MHLVDAQRLALKLMTQHGLIANGWKFEWDNSKKRFGVCRHMRFTNGGVIGLSKHLVSLNDETQVTDTILHEIAHALTKGHGHDAVWKRKCVEIGAKPERCYSSDTVNMPTMRYQAECGGCGEKYQKSRMTAKTLRPGFKQACKCQSHKPWDERILLVYKDTKL